MRHKDWDDENCYVILKNGFLEDETGGSVWKLNWDELIEDKWVILEKTLDFAAAMEEMKKGRKVRRKAWDKNYLLILYGRLHDCNHEAYILTIEDYEGNDYVVI